MSVRCRWCEETFDDPAALSFHATALHPDEAKEALGRSPACECPAEIVAEDTCVRYSICSCPTHTGEELQSHCRVCGHRDSCHTKR